jgi:hypothetical protein
MGEKMIRRRVVSVLALAAALFGASVITSAPANADVVYQQIRNWHSGKCVDVDGASQSDNAKVQQYTCNGTIAQQWRKIPTSNGFFKLVLAASGKCLTIENNSMAEGARAVQRTCLSPTPLSQQWTDQFTGGVPDWPFLVVRHSGKGLVMASESLLDRVQLIQWGWSIAGDEAPDSLHSMDWQFQ